MGLFKLSIGTCIRGIIFLTKSGWAKRWNNAFFITLQHNQSIHFPTFRIQHQGIKNAIGMDRFKSQFIMVDFLVQPFLSPIP